MTRIEWRADISARARRRWIAPALVAALCFGRDIHAAEPPGKSSAAVSEADRAGALALMREGNRLLDQGEPAKALDKFRDARRLVGGDKLRFNIAQALAGIPGRERDAYLEFEQFLELVPGAAPDVTKAAHDEIARLGTRLAFLRLEVKPTGADVKLDGATAPIEKRLVLVPGHHDLEVTATGFVSYKASLVLTLGQDRTEPISLQVVPPVVTPPVVQPPRLDLPSDVRPSAPIAPPIGDVKSQGQSQVPLAATLSASPTSNTVDEHPPLYRRWWLWAGVGAVVVGAVSIALLARGAGTTHSCPAEIPAARCFTSP